MANFPEDIAQREKFIFDEVTAGNFEARWFPLTYTIRGRQVTLSVMEDALKINGVRVNVSAALSQKLADVFDASFPTALIADMMFTSATRVAMPCPMPITTSTSAMVKHSQNVDAQMKEESGLASTVGKHWILDKGLEGKATAACNYGWHFTGSSCKGIKGFPAAFAPNVRVIQPNATAHDLNHVDYSQICQLVSNDCQVDGIDIRYTDLLQDPDLAHLVSHQGPLKTVRQPGTKPVVGTVVLFPVQITA